MYWYIDGHQLITGDNMLRFVLKKTFSYTAGVKQVERLLKYTNANVNYRHGYYGCSQSEILGI